LKLERRSWTFAADEGWGTVEYSKEYKSVSRIIQFGGEACYSLLLSVHLYTSQTHERDLTFSVCYRGTLRRSFGSPKYTVTEKVIIVSFLVSCR
jgi:hypothetical protein